MEATSIIDPRPTSAGENLEIRLRRYFPKHHHLTVAVSATGLDWVLRFPFREDAPPAPSPIAIERALKEFFVAGYAESPHDGSDLFRMEPRRAPDFRAPDCADSVQLRLASGALWILHRPRVIELLAQFQAQKVTALVPAQWWSDNDEVIDDYCRLRNELRYRFLDSPESLAGALAFEQPALFFHHVLHRVPASETVN